MGTSSLALLLALSLARVEAEAALPPLEDLWRFPRQSTCLAWVEFGQAHGQWVQEQFMRTPYPFDQAWLVYRSEINHRVVAWEELKYAWEEKNETAYRRQCLQRLRVWIGEQAYAADYVPPPLDLDYFKMMEDYR